MEASSFAAWANFYVIVGGAAAALTGLQFVVIVLGTEIGTVAVVYIAVSSRRRREERQRETLAAAPAPPGASEK
jgi:hypothetical protein